MTHPTAVPSISVMLRGSVFPRTGHRKTDRPTNRLPCRPVYELLAIKKKHDPNHEKNIDFDAYVPPREELRLL